MSVTDLGEHIYFSDIEAAEDELIEWLSKWVNEKSMSPAVLIGLLQCRMIEIAISCAEQSELH